MRKTDYFLLELFSVSLRGVQGIMLMYGIFLVSVLDILVLIIGFFFKKSVPLEGRYMCSLEMAAIHEPYRMDYNSLYDIKKTILTYKTDLELI